MEPFGIDVIDRQGNPGSRKQESGVGEVADLDELRHRLVRNLLAARLVCERVQGSFTGPGQEGLGPVAAQGRLCAAVRDLERVDDLLHEARTRSAAAG